MSDKEVIKQWLTSLANDDYVEADKLFPNVVNSALQSNINNKKVAIINSLNGPVEEAAPATENKDNGKTKEAPK